MQQRGTNIPTDQDGEEAMRLLMARYGTDVKRLCLMILKDLYLAEDAAQETFVKVWRGLDHLLGCRPNGGGARRRRRPHY